MNAKIEAPSTWAALLEEAVSKPGKLLAAYHAFHNYSFGNMLLAWSQCTLRDIPLGPIATFNRWKQLGRKVISNAEQAAMGFQLENGKSALILCQPRTWKRENDDGTADGGVYFVYRRGWFTLAQTEGDEPEALDIPEWNRDRALKALDIELVDFDYPDGNCQGFARKREIAINPVAVLPFKTTFHEMAHVVLGHTADGDCSDARELPRSLKEVEAESVAYVLTSVLELDGRDAARGYIQHWIETNGIPEKNAQRIIGAAHKILAAGKEEAA